MAKQQDEKKQFQRMTETPIPRLIISLAIPTIVSMLVTSIYNMADTYFVSKLGTSASGAVGIVFPIMTMIQAIGFTVGMGVSSVSSRLLGQRDTKKAESIVSSGLFIAVVLGVLLTIFGIVFLDKLLVLLGSTETILPFAKDYAKYILFGAPIMCASFVLNNSLRGQGRAVISMIGITAGGVLNVILDPIFIFVFKLEIAGAAIATLISQTVGLIILLMAYLLGKSSLKLRFKAISFKISDYSLIFKTGFPSFCRQGFTSIAIMLLNNTVDVYGDSAVAAMSIVGKVFMMVFSIGIGFGQGYQPVLGYNYGAKIFDRVKKSFLFTFVCITALMTALGIIGYIFVPFIMRWFIDDNEVVKIGIVAFRAQCIALPFVGLPVTCNMTFQNIGRHFSATLLSIARQGLFFIPLILILPKFLGLFGAQITQAVSDGLTFALSIPFGILFYKEISKKSV